MARLTGTAAALHRREIDWSRRSLTICEVDGPALVLGSTQPLAHVRPAQPLDQIGPATQVAVVRRRSGGAAVLVEPGELVWVEVVVPLGDRLWEDDAGRAAWWLGRAWAAALADLGLGAGEVHQGGLARSRWSTHACFAGLGPGEVTVAGRKVVGLAQRRTRHGALFQCAVPIRWEPGRLARLLALGPTEQADLVADLVGRVLPVTGHDPVGVTDALERHLPVSR
ncbi:MAG: lipoyl protein ligase domain-containing protein [Acidimicrobiales bacterium]